LPGKDARRLCVLEENWGAPTIEELCETFTHT
jgi:hypothetical protein